MYPIKQSTLLTVPFFVHDANGDAVTGLSDGSFTKRISKNGGAFGAMTVTITELENGWYSIPLSTSHTDTLGLLSVVFTNAGAKQVNLQFRVHVRLPDDLAFPTTAGRSIDVAAGGEVGVDFDNINGTLDAAEIGTDAITAAKIAANAIGASELASDAVTEIRNAITGGAYAMDTDANGRVRVVDGTGAGEIDTASGRVQITEAQIDQVVDEVWDEDIEAAHGTDATAGLLLRVLGAAISNRANNATLDALLGVADSAGNDVPAQTWAETTRTLSALGFTLGSGDFAAGFLTATLIATDAIGAAELATDAVNEIRDAILSDSTPFAGANIDATVSSRATPAQVNTEVSDVLKTDTVAEPSQTTPPATPTMQQILSYLYVALRNKIDVTSTLMEFHNDAGAVIFKKTVSDDGTTYSEAEAVSGP